MGMLAGADSIDDLGVLRAGATGRLLGAAKAPSTIGTWLWSFTYGHLRQLDAVARQLLLACWATGAGPHRLDLDSTIVETHGLAKEGAFFGYTKVRGHHPLIARVSEPGQPGWIAPYSRHTASRCTGSPGRFRRGNAAAGRGGAHFLAETIARVRAARARPGRCWSARTAASTTAGSSPAADGAKVGFSVTARIDTAVARAIASIGDDAWVPIPYWDAVGGRRRDHRGQQRRGRRDDLHRVHQHQGPGDRPTGRAPGPPAPGSRHWRAAAASPRRPGRRALRDGNHRPDAGAEQDRPGC